MFIKRFFDVLVSSLALLLLMPILLILIVLIRVNLGSPVFFKQSRPGKDTTPFTMVKFRTMRDTTDIEGNLLPDSQRLTRFGRILRASSLDELPELWNVLKGDMSIVGPRPLLMRYLPYFREEELHRFRLRPGITGLAQVNGRNNLSWDERFKLDVYYVRNQSIRLDIEIIYQTFIKVICKEDVVDAPSEAMLDLDVERSEYK